MTRRALLSCAWGLSILAVACGGSASPASPSVTAPLPAPPVVLSPPPASSEQWAVSGRVVATTNGQALGGVRVSSEVGTTAVTGADGVFRIGSETNPPFTPHKFTFESLGYMPREVYLRWQQGLRENVTVDLIPLASPFSVAFYQALVRNGFEQPGVLQPIRRWTTNPSFYIRTVDQTGRAIEPEVMALVLATIPRAVVEWTSGRLTIARLEFGSETRPEVEGWINVDLTRDDAATFCGRSRVGANPGLITLVDDRCNCGSVKISGEVVIHEVGHALGFWHVGERNAVMFPQASGGCPAGTLSGAERFHAGLAYQRPNGSLDPDRDPRSAGFLTAPDGPAPVVSCFNPGPPRWPASSN